MKNSKLKVVVFCLLFFVTTCCFFFSSTKEENSVNNDDRVMASYTTGDTYYSNTETSQGSTLIEEGNIPFSLFTSVEYAGEEGFSITDYYPEFTQSTENGVFKYTMNEDSAPYILLSSKPGEFGDILNTLYSTTLHFNFNDPNAKTDPNINYGTINRFGSLNPYVSLQTPASSTPIILQASPDLVFAGEDNSYSFSLNLQSLLNDDGSANPNVECPTISNQSGDSDIGDDNIGDYLGGNGADNDVSMRTGLYTFTIQYNYTRNGLTSNLCEFELSFYVVDYSNYLTSDSPLNFINTNVYANISEGTDGEENQEEIYTNEYQLYNYNYEEAPIVEYDASKFALNFKYRVGNSESNVLNFNYQNFVIDRQNGHTGIVTLFCQELGLPYSFYTYNSDTTEFLASFRLDDFEKNFIMPNSVALRTSVFQGVFEFELDILTQGNNEEIYTQVDKDLFNEDIQNNLSFQQLIIFGYDLRYTDSDPSSSTYGQNLSLINDYTHNTILAYNVMTENNQEENSGNLLSIPNLIATTNQAPLRFHSYGNLTGSSYTATFKLFDLASTTDAALLERLNSITTKEDIDNIIYDGTTPSQYKQFASISSDGIWLMRLEYQISIPITIISNNEDGTEYITEIRYINGCQYVLFEINNSVENLYIQGIDANTAYDFNGYTNKNVRVSIQERPNFFSAPTRVTYTYSQDYNSSSTTSSGTLSLKTNNNGNYENYVINGTIYNYYVQNNSSNYTFSANGYYVVTIRNTLTNSSRRFSFSIDKNPISDIVVNDVISSNSGYIKGDEIVSTNINSEFISRNLYITNSAFTIGWSNKLSNAREYVYVAFMELDEERNSTSSLFKQPNGDYWLTNNYYLDEVVRNAESNYENSYYLTTLQANNYFRKEGLYYFFIYDQAGNYSAIAVLIDNSMPVIAQGSWEGESEASKWNNTYDPTNNVNNYVNEDTVLYFGTHKALELPNLDNEALIEIENISYTSSYDLNNNGTIIQKTPISFDFYSDVLKQISQYIQETQGTDIFKAAQDKSTYYLLLQNSSLEYSYVPVNLGEEGANSPAYGTTYQPFYRTVIYATDNYTFTGEADYSFTLTNANGIQAIREIHMSFDNVRSSFYAYDDPNNRQYIRKNSGTNLNTLSFEYIKVNNNESLYYEIQSLTYEYYPFVLDPNDANFSIDTYPFSSVAEEGELTATSLDGQIFTVDAINVDYLSSGGTGITKPGKYVITRVYRGGGYNYDEETGTYVETGLTDEKGAYGGYYYYNSDDNEFHELFTLDPKERSYTIYVDHNEIISENYMQNSTIREVGDNINIILNNDTDNSWTFKDFYTMSNNRLLITNEVPLKINIPVSKYFMYQENGTLDYIFSNLDFSLLNVRIVYTSLTGLTSTYIVDGYDQLTGMCTSSSLISSSNPNGELIFSQEGQYQIIITDNTGYTISSSTGTTLNNNPTEFSFNFTISYTSPQAQAFSYIYNSLTGTFEEQLLDDEYNMHVYAINAPQNSGENIENNKLYLRWQDDRTPYLSSVEEIRVDYTLNNQISTYMINLSNYNLNELADGNIAILFNSSSSTPSLISQDTIDQNSFLLYLTIDYYDEINKYETYDGQNYYRYIYTLYFGIANECTYDVTLSYLGNQDFSFKQTTYSVSIDRTKPNTNLDNLISSEDFLNTYYNDSLSSFKEETFDITNLLTQPSVLTYTFGVSSNYILAYNTEETLPYFYVRSYNKYNGDFPSITPDMVGTPYYENEDIFGQYPKFSEATLNNGIITMGNNTWYRVEYVNGTTLYSLIQSTLSQTPSGYYEIIEKDYAGNFRAFTVYFSPEGQNNYHILNLDGRDANRITFEPNTTSDITADELFEISKLSSNFGWGVVSVRNETLNSNFEGLIYLTPGAQSLTPTLTQRLNEFLTSTLNCRYSFTLSRYNSTFPVVVRSVSIITNENTAKLDAPTIIEVPDIATNTSTYNLVLPAYSSTSVLYLTSLRLLIYSNSTNSWQQLLAYDNRDDIRLNNPIRNLQRGVYKVIYTDNYNTSSYEYNLYVGEYRINDFNTEYNFEYSYQLDSENEVYYTGGDVQVTYEGNIYNVYVNGVLYSGTPLETLSPSLASNNCKTFTLSSNYSYQDIPANEKVGGTTKYLIEYYDITDNTLQKSIQITIFDELPEIRLTNNNDINDEISSTLEESSSQITNSIVRIDWGYIAGCEYDILNDSDTNTVSTATLYTRDSNGLYRNGISVSRGQVVSEEGYYRLDITNSLLGNTRSVYFVIQFGNFPLYSVLVGDEELSPSPYENFDLTLNETNKMAYFMSNTQAQPIIDIIYTALTQMKDNGLLQNIIDRNRTEYDILVESLGYQNGNFSSSNIGIANVTKLNHYYSIYTPEIVYNSNIDIDIIEFTFQNNYLTNFFLQGTDGRNPTPDSVGTDYWTTIYLVYSLRGPIRIELFAVTKVPQTSNLLSSTIYYNENSTINLTVDTTEKQLTNNELTGNDVVLHWNSLNSSITEQNTYWYNQGNFIYILEQYGVENNYSPLEYSYNSSNNRNTSTLYGAGTHKLMFRDLAGNTHRFSNNSLAFEPNVYTIYVITQVIYHINYNGTDYNPIQYGVFNNNLDLVIDEYYLNMLDGFSISVTRNGVSYTSYIRNDNIISFNASGKYVVTLRASHDGRDLNPATYTFTIISTSSARLAFEFTETSNYEILQVIRNNEDITDNFMVNGTISSIFISSSDSRSGNGYYTITLKYGESNDEVLVFSFLISDYVPSISSSIGYGETTTSEIVISYNPSYIYNQLGECYINVLVYNQDSGTFYQYGRFTIDETTTSTYSGFTLTQSNSYFIQVETANGNVISSFRVNKTDPLNTFAIIIIVIVVIAVIVLIIVVIKLRTRMKVR